MAEAVGVEKCNGTILVPDELVYSLPRLQIPDAQRSVEGGRHQILHQMVTYCCILDGDDVDLFLYYLMS